MRRLPVGLSDFKELLIDDYYFVDKSLLVKEVMQDGATVLLITRPRRFGKTLNLSMLDYFFNVAEKDEPNIFENLLIAQDVDFCAKHQNKYPVIALSFKDIKAATFAASYADIEALLSDLYEDHSYLLTSAALSESEKNTYEAILNKQAKQTEIQNSLKKLAKYLHKHFKQKVVLLLDEYDTPIYPEMIYLMRSMLGQVLKDDKHLQKSVVTGITKVSKESMYSGLNNLEIYSLLREKYGQYFGFTEDEVAELDKKCGQNSDLSIVKQWYNGYQIGRYVLYNPWSIISCLKNDGQCEPYWVNTATHGLLEHLLSKAPISVKENLEDLMQGNSITQGLSDNLVFGDIEKEPAALWNLFLYAGYLKVLSVRQGEFSIIANLAIPNKEVRYVYNQIVSRWFSKNTSLESYERFTKSLLDGNILKFKEYISNYIMQSGSYFDFTSNAPEQIFHIFTLGLVAGLRDYYVINSQQFPVKILFYDL
jgi:hypothetical protein